MTFWSDWGSVKLEHPYIRSQMMVECHVKMIRKHLRKVGSTHQRDWEERLPILLLAYQASTHETTGETPANMLFGWKLRLPCDLMTGAPQTRKNRRDSTGDLIERLHDIHHFAQQNLNVVSDWMKARYDQLANSAGFQEVDRVWLYCPNWKRRNSPKLDVLGRPLHLYPDRHTPDSAASKGKGEGHPPGQIGTISGATWDKQP
jgi:hypothetical protein